MKTKIHINQHHIKANHKGAELPVITVKDYRQNRKTNTARIMSQDGTEVATVVYSPNKPLCCGARVWIETELEVITEEKLNNTY